MKASARSPRPNLAPTLPEAASFGPVAHNAWQLHADHVSFVSTIGATPPGIPLNPLPLVAALEYTL